MGVESIRRKREVLTISCPGRGAAPHKRVHARLRHARKRVHARLRRAMGRCTAGPGHKIAKTTPCKVKWAPARSTRAALRSGHEKKNGPSSRPSLISSRSIFLFEHDLFGKPVPTFPDHALARPTRLPGPRPEIPRGIVGIIVEAVQATGHGRRVRHGVPGRAADRLTRIFREIMGLGVSGAQERIVSPL